VIALSKYIDTTCISQSTVSVISDIIINAFRYLLCYYKKLVLMEVMNYVTYWIKNKRTCQEQIKAKIFLPSMKIQI